MTKTMGYTTASNNGRKINCSGTIGICAAQHSEKPLNREKENKEKRKNRVATSQEKNSHLSPPYSLPEFGRKKFCKA